MTGSLPKLTGVHVLLRSPALADIETRHAIGRHREIVEAYGNAFDPQADFTRDHAATAIRFIEAQEHAWVIDVGGFIGHIRFHSFAPADRRCALAIGIEDPAMLGKGYGTEAINLALSYIFAKGMHRVSLRVLATNSRAIRSYRKSGFVEEGREREAAFVAGTWQDDIIMGLLRSEFSGDTPI